VKVNLDAGIRHQGTIGGNAVRMSFDQDAIAHLMSLLTDLYSDPLLAVIREYSTNALDSHVEAGNPNPIEVTLPSPLHPVFIVQDYGVGLSVDDIIHHLTKYGWSSKRHTNEAVGMLGIGFKSALTYTSQFTVVSVHNGVKAVVLVTRAEDGTGQIEIIDTLGTDEPNGVKIQVPVSDVATFNVKANKFFRFWESGTVLVNGSAPKPLEGDQIDPSILLTGEVECDYLVMGNVPYPIPYGHNITNLRNSYAVVTVPIGEVDFTPSREALQMTARTKEILSDARDWIKNYVARAVQDELDAATDAPTALGVAQKWRSILPTGHSMVMRFQGAQIPAIFEAWGKEVQSWTLRYDKAAKVRGAVRVDEAQKSVFILNYRQQGVPAANKEEIESYLTENHPTVKKVFLSRTDWVGEWISDDQKVDWQDVKPKRQKSVRLKREPASYDVVTRQGPSVVQKIDTTQPIYWVPKTQLASTNCGPSGLMTLVADKGTVVILGLNRITKFQRDYPTAQPFANLITAQADALRSELTTGRKLRMSQALGRYEALRNVQINDPAVAKYVNLATVVDPFDYNGWRHRYNIVTKVARRFWIDVSINLKPEFDDPLANYPLLANMGDYNLRRQDSDAAEYINAVYAARLKES
jgi:hypothetical protein